MCTTKISRNGELGEEIAAGAQVTPRAINEMIETFVSKYRNAKAFCVAARILVVWCSNV